MSYHGWQWVAGIVIANAGISLLLALLINNVVPGRRYPMQISAPATQNEPVSCRNRQTSMGTARMDSVIDVSIKT